MHRKLLYNEMDYIEKYEIGPSTKKVKTSSRSMDQTKCNNSNFNLGCNYNNESRSSNTKQLTDALKMNIESLPQNDVLKMAVLSQFPSQVNHLQCKISKKNKLFENYAI